MDILFSLLLMNHIELVYDDTEVPYVINYYDNTFVCYSYSKALSLPGERIGYIVVSPKMIDEEDAYAAVCGAGRAFRLCMCPKYASKSN